MKNIIIGFFISCGLFAVKAPQVNTIDHITNAYINVKNSLAADNAPLAKSRAGILLSELSAQPGKELLPAQQKVLAKYADQLKFDARHISETDKIDHQREHFESLSKNMYALVSALKINKQTLYQQYCPMKKAYWLSESEEIRNPYYGSKMLECGDVKITLKPAVN
ncbi:DUF3347 domain-containing protein [Mucilaginibacter segetis]|uniref:DUF3347 domain-containing protein n=1 Tax=Mucilaginibacter segetis TaxID=2793071 RepID=A0A934UNC7_9SPHI|nr:DUF3347 domain-containing protein [Mucilaginibacter segetis]MBK0379777.1 DUF3347 domain-containing protein [Mucilaginibacter segetis]